MTANATEEVRHDKGKDRESQKKGASERGRRERERRR